MINEILLLDWIRRKEDKQDDLCSHWRERESLLLILFAYIKRRWRDWKWGRDCRAAITFQIRPGRERAQKKEVNSIIERITTRLDSTQLASEKMEDDDVYLRSSPIISAASHVMTVSPSRWWWWWWSRACVLACKAFSYFSLSSSCCVMQ